MVPVPLENVFAPAITTLPFKVFVSLLVENVPVDESANAPDVCAYPVTPASAPALLTDQFEVLMAVVVLPLPIVRFPPEDVFKIVVPCAETVSGAAVDEASVEIPKIY